MKLSKILEAILKEHGNSLPKTKLLKLAYLIDLTYARRFGKRIIDETWIYYLYGPYIEKYGEILTEGPFEINEVETEDETIAQLVTLEEFRSRTNLELELSLIVEKVVSEYGEIPLKELLNYIYFETEPMMNARRRMENLNFGTVQNEAFYKVKELKISPEDEEEIRKRFREKIKKFRGE